MLRRDVFAVTAAAALLSTLAGAQAVHKDTLQTQPFPGPVYHTVMVHTLMDPGGTVAWHTHPGVEMAYVAQGRATLRVKGRPDQPVAAGGSFSIPVGTVHSVQNTSSGPLVLISTYVVDKNKPIVIPAPGP
jgi:quercetin dioxygenase-like cupin family protein